ncbi:probable jasmonic acid carboxyl methyltransferase 2 [Amaranthus tricolor]|uniref:probable jasmonic acid carboxyl methyltransferase 2 n=1 Tax=Amaranthus tricolor TaxID=29722 RepID=UPI0025883540|nr:probable jasmonic acid carboxyl methyltransferase 2 [Amaranthus tricolor]
MDMLQVFHMNKGQGESSYAQNCTVQKKIMLLAKSYLKEAIQGYLKNGYPESMVIADLGCSSGPTALEAVSDIIEAVVATCPKHLSPKFMVFLNDLPKNDFNGVFASFYDFQEKWRKQKGDDFGPCFIAGLPGSFYGRLLPPNGLHFIHSSSSLHWLSQVPQGLNEDDQPRILNKGNVYISRTSTMEVVMAYKQQFRNDFLTFLKCRASEMISSGRMVLTFVGRNSVEPTSLQDSYPWDFISHCLATMVSEGLIEEEKLDSFNVPYYAPCLEEIKELVDEESSFSGHIFEAVEVEWDGGINLNDESSSLMMPTKGERIAKMHRAVAESMLQHYFGADLMDDFFHRYAQVLDDYLIQNPNSKSICLVVSLIKN